MSHFVRSLPRIAAQVGHKPQKLKTSGIPSRIGRLEILRTNVTKLMREERLDMTWNRALETRPYMERLLQLAIERGAHDEYTMEMCDWWVMEKDLIHKLFKVFVPRFENYPAPYTRLFRLPTQRMLTHRHRGGKFWKEVQLAVLELKGNPFPPVVPAPENHENSLLNVLLREEAKRRRKEDATSSESEQKSEKLSKNEENSVH